MEWKLAEVDCSLDGHGETIAHALFDCTMLNNAFAKINPPFVCHDKPIDVRSLL